MFLDKLEWAGSSDRIEFHLATNRANDAFKDIATTLTSMLPNHWPQYRDEFGNMATRDQFKQWMAELGRLHDVNGFVVVARHTSSGNNIIAVAIAEPNGKPNQAKQGPQTRGGYCAEEVDPMMVAVLRKACFDRGRLVLGNPEMREVWVAV